MTTATLSDLTTVMGIATVVTILTQIILNAANLSDDSSNRWGPLLAIGLGVVVAVGASFALGMTGGTDLSQAAYTGLIGGATAIALHGVATKSAVGAAIAAALGITSQPPKVTGLTITSQVKAQ
jgi:hypothetical protein